MWARPSPYPTQDIERPALPSLSPVFVRMTGNVTSAAPGDRQDRGQVGALVPAHPWISQPLPAVLVKSSWTIMSLKSWSPPPSVSSQPQVLRP